MADKKIDPKLPGKDEPAAGTRKAETRETAKKGRNLTKKGRNLTKKGRNLTKKGRNLT